MSDVNKDFVYKAVEQAVDAINLERRIATGRPTPVDAALVNLAAAVHVLANEAYGEKRPIPEVDHYEP
jgi:hypothetical protein